LSKCNIECITGELLGCVIAIGHRRTKNALLMFPFRQRLIAIAIDLGSLQSVFELDACKFLRLVALKCVGGCLKCGFDFKN
ncbi:MAG: hypothetical protein EBX39_13960, partial [Actinobacteria bacterium]|nr:hypothetical protein [Actinomycetota bacterium]